MEKFTDSMSLMILNAAILVLAATNIKLRNKFKGNAELAFTMMGINIDLILPASIIVLVAFCNKYDFSIEFLSALAAASFAALCIVKGSIGSFLGHVLLIFSPAILSVIELFKIFQLLSK